MSTNISKKLEGKTAVVTGASKGIGAAIATHLAAEGAAVVVNYASSKAGADKVVAEITAAGGKAIAVQGDVSKQADINNLFSKTKQAFGKVDVLINNPGMIETEGLHSAGFAESDFRKQIESLTPLGRIGQPDDTAKVAVFLASDDSGWVTGETLLVSGGNY